LLRFLLNKHSEIKKKYLQITSLPTGGAGGVYFFGFYSNKQTNKEIARSTSGKQISPLSFADTANLKITSI